MTEVGHADLSRLLHSKRNEFSTIVTSRKRKLRELFAVATQVEGLPTDVLANADAPPTTPAEIKFLQDNDILQGKPLNEQTIPSRSKPTLDATKRPATASPAPTPQAAPRQPQQQPNNNAPRPPVASSPQVAHPAIVPQPVKRPDAVAAVPAAKTIAPAAQLATSDTSRTSSPAPRSAASTPARIASPATTTPVAPATSEATARSRQPVPPPVQATTRDQRPPQVTFPPGTKSPPLVSNGQGGTQPPGVKDSLSIKLPDQVKASDAVSSPSSTVHSATTPAVHDASADTSPEIDGPRHTDVSQRKLSDSESAPPPKVQAPIPTQPKVTDEAEEQLLQESIRSSVAPDEHDAPATTAPVASPAVPVGPPKEAHDAAQAVPSKSVEVSQSEIPDSQEEGPDLMDVDKSEAIAEETTKPTERKAVAPKEPNLPTQQASMSPQAEKAVAKETSQAPPERAVTRVSSGAMRARSVHEIVGATPRSSHVKDSPSQLTPATSAPPSPASRSRNGTHKRDRSRGQATVFFGKQPKRVEDKSVVQQGHRESLQASDDYFTPLFLQNYASGSNWMQPLEKILFHANKTLGTPDTNLAIHEHQACRVLKKVYNLQQSEKWSLRQPKRATEPTRPPSQWDVLLREMKWMRTDFREERKWKRAVARNLANACAAWHEADPEERKTMQVAATSPPIAGATEDVAMADATAEANVDDPSTPDLVSSGDMESPQVVDELNEDFVETVSPSAIFTLQEDDVIFGLRRSPTSDRLLEELPLYGSPLEVPKMGLMGPESDPDAHWRRPALPINKYVEGQMKLDAPGPPRKRSRFDYENEDSDDELEAGFVNNQVVQAIKLPPSTDEVALFNPESKAIRDRLHAGHQFRPPSEYVMPTQNFYESRSPSQWTVAEDDELRALVRDFSYNWSLISSMLSTQSMFASGAERRTPWECFERWITLEGMPTDMQRTQYFKTYNNRIEAAQRVIAQQNQLAAQQASASGSQVTPVRRRQSTPLRVERRRNQKHLTIIDAMRKLAKKRETAAHKQQHTASQNAAKKPNENIAQKSTKTPREYSLLRWERDQALAEKMAQYAQRQDAQRRAAIQQARAQQAGGQQAVGTPNGTQPGPNGQNGGNNAMNGGGRSNMPNQVAAAAAAAGQGRPRSMQGPGNAMGAQAAAQAQMNGAGLVPPQMNGALQAQMQAMQQQGVQGQQRMQMANQQQQPDANLMLRAQRMAEQQRAAVMQQQAQHPQHHQQTPQQQQQHHQQQQQHHQQQQQLHQNQQHHQQQHQQHQGQQQVQQHQHAQHAQHQQQQHAQHQRAGSGTPGPTSQAGSPPLRNGVNGANGVNPQNFANAAHHVMAQYGANANTNGHATTPGSNGMPLPSASTGSPGQRPPMQLPASIATQLSQLEAQFKAKNPNLTPEQARHLATEHLTRAMMAQRQNAMNAAAGATNSPGIASSIAATTSPHQYAALLRQQQQQQAQQQAQQLAQQQQQQQQQGQQKSPVLQPPQHQGQSKSPVPPPQQPGKSKSPVPPPQQAGQSKSPVPPPQQAGQSKSPVPPPQQVGQSKSPVPPPQQPGQQKSPVPPPQQAQQAARPASAASASPVPIPQRPSSGSATPSSGK